MYELRILLIIIFYRLKNRCFIFASQRPELFFGLMLIIVSFVSFLFFLPFLFNYAFPATVDLFPNLSYSLIVTSFCPFLIWILKKNESTVASFSLLDYVFKDYMKYLKVLGTYFTSGILSVVMVYLVVSIFSNIPTFYSTLFWHCVGLSLFLISYAIALLINNVLGHFKILYHNSSFFKYMLVIVIMVVIALPVHKLLGTIWISQSLSSVMLVISLMLLVALYMLLLSYPILVQENRTEQKVGFLRFKRKISVYITLVLIDIYKNFWFLFLVSTFLVMLSIIAGQYFIMLELFFTLLVIGNVGLIFDKLDKITRPIYIVRASNFKFSLCLLCISYTISLLCSLCFYLLISQISSESIVLLFENSDFIVKNFVLYFSIYLSILIYYLFGDYFGLFARSIVSGLILVITSRVVPLLIERMSFLGNNYLKIGIIFFVFLFLLLVQWVTVYEYKNSEFI